jgi:hypothetical protein
MMPIKENCHVELTAITPVNVHNWPLMPSTAPYLQVASYRLAPGALLKLAASKHRSPAIPVALAVVLVVACVAVVEVDRSHALALVESQSVHLVGHSCEEVEEDILVDTNFAAEQRNSVAAREWVQVERRLLRQRKRELLWIPAP